MKTILSTGISLSIGSVAISKLGGNATIQSNAQKALGLGSLVMPMYAAKNLMKVSKKLL